MTTAIPESPEQLEEALHDGTKMNNIFAEGNFGQFMSAYVQAFVKGSKDDVSAFKERAQADMQSFMQAQAERNVGTPAGDWKNWKAGDPMPGGAAGRSARRSKAVARSRFRDAGDLFDRQGLFSADAAGAAEEVDNAEYSDSLTKFVWATLKGEYVARQGNDPELLGKLQTFKGNLARTMTVRNAGTMSERVPGEGGFLVPETLRSDILSLSLEDSVMRPLSTVIPMDSLRVPLPIIDDTSHTSSVFGGVQAFWTAEGAALKASSPEFGRINLIANKLTGFTMIPNELLQDAASPMDVWFRTFFPQAIAFFEDLAFLVGNGVNQPEGILNCPGAVKVTPGTGGQVLFADLAKMMARMWPPSLKRAVWICSPDVLPYLYQLAMAPGGTAIAPPAWLADMQAIEAPGGGDGSGYNFKLFGRPVRVSEKVPYPGNTSGPGATLQAGSISLIDPTYYLLGDRQQMQIASSAEYSFATDEVAYRVIERVDGRGWFRTPLTPANGSSNTLSPYVLLNT